MVGASMMPRYPRPACVRPHAAWQSGLSRASWRGLAWAAGLLGVGGLPVLAAATAAPIDGAHEASELAIFRSDIEPVLDQYCYDCHGYGSDKGGVTLDGFESDGDLLNPALWLRAFKNVRGGLMPPKDEVELPEEERAQLLSWIKGRVFAADPQNPDPGRVTLRRLNRVEYRNTIRDLLGVDYATDEEFPADDTGHGFDNIADVLTVSPMLLEKYVDAAQVIVDRAVPTQPRVVAEHRVKGRDLQSRWSASEIVAAALVRSREEAGASNSDAIGGVPAVSAEGGVTGPTLEPQVGTPMGDSLDLLYYAPARVGTTFEAVHGGQYQVELKLHSVERYLDDQFDYNECRLRVRLDGEVVLEQRFVREGTRHYTFTFDREWQPGRHEIEVEIEPTTFDLPQPRRLRLRLQSVAVRGPAAPEFWVPPPRYAEFFPGQVPTDPAAREAYVRARLRAFATRAYRRPVEEGTLQRLTELALATAAQPDTTIEAGVAQAMVAVLASPRFIFREEDVEPVDPGATAAPVDEYALASRLSYFLWSSMPDDELLRLAGERRLRAELSAQVQRLLADPKAAEFVRNFTGQWLQARDVTTVAIENFDVFLRDHPNPEVEEARKTFRRIIPIPEAERTGEQKEEFQRARTAFRQFMQQPRPQLNSELREAMQRETQMLFEYVLKEDRSVLDFLTADYVHVNEVLARHYGIEGVEGPQMRKVQLPPDHPRGGVLTQGTVLTVTSNPTRTSPVKRGVFILDNILGAPPPPPPPDIPSLEDAASPERLKELSLRETLALHAENRLCRSCHNRMDPLGLALENFNAMGAWRESELNRPIEPEGTLMTGQSFTDVRELKRILATDHRENFFHCLAEKMLTYALGRGLEYYDTETLDQLVARLEAADGRMSALVTGIIESAPFQKRRLHEHERLALLSRGSAQAAHVQP